MIKNRQKKIYLAFALLSLVFLLIILYGIISPDSLGDMMPPVLFLSFFLGISCMVITIMFWRRSRLIDSAMAQKNYIARWQFSPSEWEKYINYEYQKRSAQRKAAFIFLGIITVIIFTIFIFIIDDAQLAMFLTMLGLLGILALFAFVIPFLIYKASKREAAEVLILNEGILLNQQFHSWNYFSSDLLSAQVKEKPFKHLEVVYSYVTRFGKQAYTVFVPVPEGEDAAAVVKKLLAAQ